DLCHRRPWRAVRERDVPAVSIRDAIGAMRAVAGMTNPLLEACLVRTGTRLAFRCSGAMVDPIRRQLLFDFERLDQYPTQTRLSPLRRPGLPSVAENVQHLFLAAHQ